MQTYRTATEDPSTCAFAAAVEKCREQERRRATAAAAEEAKHLADALALEQALAAMSAALAPVRVELRCGWRCSAVKACRPTTRWVEVWLRGRRSAKAGEIQAPGSGWWVRDNNDNGHAAKDDPKAALLVLMTFSSFQAALATAQRPNPVRWLLGLPGLLMLVAATWATCGAVAW